MCKERSSTSTLVPTTMTNSKNVLLLEQKLLMARKKFIRWDHLDRLHIYTLITDHDHPIRDPELILDHLKQARSTWKACKKKCSSICQKFLEERAAFCASKLRCSEEKALCAILKSEESKKVYST
jgi:hypothetical protein